MDLLSKPGRVIFAPMEGITCDTYRGVIEDLYPEWDILSSDFLRVPSAGRYPQKHLLKHFGHQTYNSHLKQKTIFQILASPTSYITEITEDLEKLDIPWLDLNLGCPSKTVVKNQGGSFLLSKPKELRKIIRTIRKSFKKTFTVKIRVGFTDDHFFEDNLKLFEEEGVEAITIHGRTREQLYKGKANWGYLKKAVETVSIPIIGNGDIWKTEDIKSCLESTGCHSVMIARGALKTPWLAQNYKQGIEDSPLTRKKKLNEYFKNLLDALNQNGLPEATIHRRFKGLARFPFEDDPELRSKLLRSKNLSRFFELMNH